MAVENDIKISGGYLNCVVSEVVIKGDMIEIKYHDTEPPKYLNGPVDVYVCQKNSNSINNEYEKHKAQYTNVPESIINFGNKISAVCIFSRWFDDNKQVNNDALCKFTYKDNNYMIRLSSGVMDQDPKVVGMNALETLWNNIKGE